MVNWLTKFDKGVTVKKPLLPLRLEIRDLAYTHGWNMINAGHRTDVFRLQDDDDEYRYLYCRYTDMGFDLTLTCLALPHTGDLITISDMALARPLVEDWIINHTWCDEDEFVEHAEDGQ